MERPIKRARQACEPCRRKKSRCPGEKPTCSFCARLKQSCKYADEGEDSTKYANGDSQISAAWLERFETLENKLDMVLTRILPSLAQESSIFATPLRKKECSSPMPQRLPVELHQKSSTSGNRNSLQGISLPAPVILALVETYIRYCDCQPLSIFDVETLRCSIDACTPEVMYSILALSLRFPHSPPSHDDPNQLAVEYAERARRIIMEQFIEGTVKLSSLQALCLQAFFDLTAGNTQRAWLSVGIGMRLLTSAKLNLESQATALDRTTIEERRRCFWGFCILEHLCSDAISGPLSLPHERPPFPPSLSLRSEDEPPNMLPKFGDYSSEEAQDKGIIGYSLQLLQLWKKTLQYVIIDSKSTEAPWSSGSDYFSMVASVMEWETYLCKNHRSAHARFSSQSSTGLLQNSRYWGPWLNVQFTYHATLNLINHPCFLFSKIQSLSGAVSTSFVESASDLALLHAKHIARLTVSLEEKEFEASDPFLGYCAVVAATTHLWYCHGEDRGVREQAKARFATCYKFVARLAGKWPIAKRMANNLLSAKTLASSWKVSPDPPFTPIEIPTTDMDLIWDLLSYPVRDMSIRNSNQNTISYPVLSVNPNPTPNNRINSTTSTQHRPLRTEASLQTVEIKYQTEPPPYETPATHQVEFEMNVGVDDGTMDIFGDSFNSQDFPYEEGVGGWWNTGNL